MSISYQALLGETSLNADSIVVQDLVAEKGIIAHLDVTENFYVEGLTELDDATINKLTIPTGAADGSILTSNATGLATWKPNVHDGDITGSASATVQHHKWIGNWDVATPYQKFNRVTHFYVEYRAVIDNVGIEPMIGDQTGTWEVVLSYRLDTVFEEKAQPLHNKTDVDVVDLTVHNSAKFTIQPTSMFEITPRYLVGTGVNKDELRWANNLDAQQISCRNTFYYENDGRADAGKVLTCVGNTGACNWEYPTQTNVMTMLGDVTGQSNASVVNTLAGGTIHVADLLTAADLPTDIVLETKAQPLRNKTDADIIDLTVHNSLKLKVSTIPSGTYNIKYLVGFMNPDFNDCAWINDLYAPIISAQSQLLYPVNAAAGKVLSCVDSTGLAQWITPPSTAVTMGGDVTGSSSASTVYTLAGGTIPVNQLVTVNGTQTLKFKMLNDALNAVFANGLRGGNGWAIPLSGSGPTTNQVLSFNGSFGTWTTPTFPTLGGDVTGSYGATTVNTLAGGTIPVNQLVTLEGEQIIKNKGLAGMILFSDLSLTKTFRIFFDYASMVTQTMLIITSTANRSIMLPDASDTLMGKITTDVMKNKTITDISNTVYANGIHYPPTWTANFAGGAPTTNQVLRFDGTNAVWSSVSPLVSLAGDASGLATNNVVSKATNDFTVGRLLNCKFGIQIKKLVLHEGGGSVSVNDHDFQGFGTSSSTLRYHVNALTSAHVFYAATSYTASNELARISGGGDLNVTRTISASNGDRIKKIVLYEGGTNWDSTDHRFNGPGTASNTHRDQVNNTTDNHVFYAATSATASNELFKIMGTGDVTCSKKIVSATTQAFGWAATTNQGAYTGWNRNSGSGRTTFANQMGLGYGGWEWVNYNNSNVQTPSGNPAMSLDRDGNLTVRGRVISEGVPDAFSGNWWSADTDIILLTVPLQSSGQFCNLRETIVSINFSAWTNDANGIFLPVAGYFRISYRYRLASREKINIMLKCNVSVGGTNHPSLYTFDMGLTYEHDLHCEAIVNISAPNMWVSYPRLTVYDSSQVTNSKNFDLFTGHFTIEKMK